MILRAPNLLALAVAGLLTLATAPLLAQDEPAEEPTSDAEPSGWEKTFDPESLPMVGEEQRYVVVTARGEPDAGDALRRSLEEAGVELAMKGGDVADMTGLSDEEILGKTENLPVDRVVVVRVTEMDDAPMAVVTIYKTDGSSVGGYTARRGEPVEADKGSSGPSGVTKDTVSSAIESTKSGETSGEESESKSDGVTKKSGRYTLHYFGGSRQLRDNETDAKYTGKEIYETLGLDSLADQYDQNIASQKRWRTIGHGTWIGGTAAVGLGGYFIYRSYFPLLDGARTIDGPCSDIDNDRVRHNCRIEQKRQDLTGLRVGGIATAAAGLGAVVTGLILLPEGNPHPVSMSALSDRIEEINESESKKSETEEGSDGGDGGDGEGAGKSSESGASSSSLDSTAPRVQILPAIGPRSGAVYIRVRF